jgi:hypothetical protein
MKRSFGMAEKKLPISIEAKAPETGSYSSGEISLIVVI